MLFGIDIQSNNLFKKTPFEYNKDKLEPMYKGMTVRIIVPAKDKSKINSELDAIGINHAFLFPELEHQAAYIKQQYSFSSESDESDETKDNP